MPNDLFKQLAALHNAASLRINKREIKALEERLNAIEWRQSAKSLVERFPLMAEIAARQGFSGIEILPLRSDQDFTPSTSTELSDVDINPSWLVGNAKAIHRALVNAGFAPQLVVFGKAPRGIKRISNSYWALIISWA